MCSFAAVPLLLLRLCLQVCLGPKPADGRKARSVDVMIIPQPAGKALGVRYSKRLRKGGRWQPGALLSID